MFPILHSVGVSHQVLPIICLFQVQLHHTQPSCMWQALLLRPVVDLLHTCRAMSTSSYRLHLGKDIGESFLLIQSDIHHMYVIVCVYICIYMCVCYYIIYIYI